MILLNLPIIVILMYFLARYFFIPFFRKKTILIYGKIIALISVLITCLVLINFPKAYILATLAPVIAFALFAYKNNLHLIFGSSRETIIDNIQKVTLGMSLETRSSSNNISVPSLELNINISEMIGIRILRFNSSSKSDKLKLLQAVTRKFITA